MRLTLLTACLVTLVATPPMFAGERENLMAKLAEVHERIEKLESVGRKVPQEFRRMEEEFHEALEHLDERKFVGDKALEMLERLSEAHGRGLRALREHNEEEFHEMLGDIVPWLEEMERMREEDPELFELERKSHDLQFNCEELAGKAREAEPKAQDRLKGDLRQRLAELFELRLSMRRLQIRRLEAELAEVRRQVEKMSTRQDEMIERRLEQLFNMDDDW